MACEQRLDLLLREIQDPYVRENFHKLKRYLDCLAENSGGTVNEGDTTIVVGGGTETAFHKNDFVVDAPFILSKVVTLGFTPVEDSEGVYLNGLLLSDSCYTLAGVTLTLDSGMDLRVGDEIFIRYASES